MREAVKIIAMSVLAAVVYGVLHDQITARVCVEYFTIGHPPVFRTQSPTLLALGWGVIATWWVGLPLGVMLAVCARKGPNPRLTARELLRPLAIMLCLLGIAACVFGLIGYILARNDVVRLLDRIASAVPIEKHDAFVADLWAHTCSYFGGVVGTILLCLHVRRLRRRRAVPSVSSSQCPRSPNSNAMSTAEA